MKVKIDTIAKTITLLENINLEEFKREFRDDWKDYVILTSPQVVYEHCTWVMPQQPLQWFPVYPYYQPYYVQPAYSTLASLYFSNS